MAITDPIADMLTMIRNANKAVHKTVTIPHSKMKLSIVDIMLKAGFIGNVKIEEEGKKKFLLIDLKYAAKNERVLLGLRRLSRSGRRYYVDKDHIPSVQGGLGIAILSTSKGIITDKEARQLQIGGEVLCKIW